eukprot:1153219-Pelagomonas_calceolata.AAC.3
MQVPIARQMRTGNNGMQNMQVPIARQMCTGNNGMQNMQVPIARQEHAGAHSTSNAPRRQQNAEPILSVVEIMDRSMYMCAYLVGKTCSRIMFSCLAFSRIAFI